MSRKWLRPALALVAVTALLEVGGPPRAQANICVNMTPEQGPYCPTDHIPRPPPPEPPPEPDCPMDPPPGLICKEGPKEVFEFVGSDTWGNTTRCEVWLKGATPPDQNGGELIQFRTTADCHAGMRNVTIDTRLLNSTQAVVGSGNQAYCHEFATGASCGTSTMTSDGSVAGQPAGEYTLVATVRLALREGTGDPWVTVAGTTPAGSAEACAPGSYVTRCELRLPITADGI